MKNDFELAAEELRSIATAKNYAISGVSLFDREGNTKHHIDFLPIVELLLRASEVIDYAERYRALRLEHERFDPIARVAWKRNDDRNTSEWVNVVDADDLDMRIDSRLRAVGEQFA